MMRIKYLGKVLTTGLLTIATGNVWANSVSVGKINTSIDVIGQQVTITADTLSLSLDVTPNVIVDVSATQGQGTYQSFIPVNGDYQSETVSLSWRQALDERFFGQVGVGYTDTSMSIPGYTMKTSSNKITAGLGGDIYSGIYLAAGITKVEDRQNIDASVALSIPLWHTLYGTYLYAEVNKIVSKGLVLSYGF